VFFSARLFPYYMALRGNMTQTSVGHVDKRALFCLCQYATMPMYVGHYDVCMLPYGRCCTTPIYQLETNPNARLKNTCSHEQFKRIVAMEANWRQSSRVNGIRDKKRKFIRLRLRIKLWRAAVISRSKLNNLPTSPRQPRQYPFKDRHWLSTV
jgi:hypothetical protein